MQTIFEQRVLSMVVSMSYLFLNILCAYILEDWFGYVLKFFATARGRGKKLFSHLLSFRNLLLLPACLFLSLFFSTEWSLCSLVVSMSTIGSTDWYCSSFLFNVLMCGMLRHYLLSTLLLRICFVNLAEGERLNRSACLI